jgi:glutathione synthase/RimK-type ligase-like ATP-grasp enzyme
VTRQAGGAVALKANEDNLAAFVGRLLVANTCDGIRALGVDVATFRVTEINGQTSLKALVAAMKAGTAK